MSMHRYFPRRTYSFRTFIKDTKTLIKKRSVIKRAMKSERISKTFRERIMLVVTAVNGCRYCAWAHIDWAKKSGCTEEEITELMKFNFNFSKPEESIALMFAQHYAETYGEPEQAAIQKLKDFYGEDTAEDIQTIIQMITIGNLLGNTFDAFLSRFKGRPPEHGSFIFEFLVFLFGFPILLPYRFTKSIKMRKKEDKLKSAKRRQ